MTVRDRFASAGYHSHSVSERKSPYLNGIQTPETFLQFSNVQLHWFDFPTRRHKDYSNCCKYCDPNVQSHVFHGFRSFPASHPSIFIWLLATVLPNISWWHGVREWRPNVGGWGESSAIDSRKFDFRICDRSGIPGSIQQWYGRRHPVVRVWKRDADSRRRLLPCNRLH